MYMTTNYVGFDLKPKREDFRVLRVDYSDYYIYEVKQGQEPIRVMKITYKEWFKEHLLDLKEYYGYEKDEITDFIFSIDNIKWNSLRIQLKQGGWF